jgi:hypothetical protein
MGKATPHPADRQPCGYKSTHREVQSPAPGTSCFEIEWDILEGRERGLGFGSFFLCSVVCFVFLLTYLFFGLITSCCISLLYVINIPNDFLSPESRFS